MERVRGQIPRNEYQEGIVDVHLESSKLNLNWKKNNLALFHKNV